MESRLCIKARFFLIYIYTFFRILAIHAHLNAPFPIKLTEINLLPQFPPFSFIQPTVGLFQTPTLLHLFTA